MSLVGLYSVIWIFAVNSVCSFTSAEFTDNAEGTEWVCI